jgi:hypothetical protein
MKFRIDQTQRLYSQPSLSAFTGVEIPVGEELEVGGEVKKNGAGFCPVRRSNGQSGFIPADTRASHIKPMTINQKEAAFYGAPSMYSWVRTPLAQNARIWMYPGTVQDGVNQFVRIRDAQGNEGYILGNTQVKGVVEVTRQLALKNMLVGGLWCVGGLIVTIASMSASQGGIICFGAVIFGGAQFFKGLGQLASAQI